MIFSDFLKKLSKPVLALLLFAGAGTLPAAGQSERISLENRKMSAGEVMRAVEAQTNFRFAYSYAIFDTKAIISLPDRNVTVRQILDSIVEQEDVKYVMQGRYIAFVPKTPGDRPQVHGKSQRTSDVYIPGMSDGSASSVSRPGKPQPQERPGQEQPKQEQPKQEQLRQEQPKREQPKQGQPKQVSKPVSVPAAVYPAPYSAYVRPDRYAELQTSLPRFALKTNLLYGGLALAPNFAFEFATGPKHTIELSGSYNGWRRSDNDPVNTNTSDTKQLVHSIFRGEYRWWLCERFNGHFLGAHAFYARYHVSAKNIPLLFDKENRYDGHGYGAGVTYGYNLPLGKRWGLEFNVGVGAAYIKYDKYTCASCDMEAVKTSKWYVGPTRAGVTLVFLIK